MTYFDFLRPPPPFDPSAPAYKDWLHLNIIDHTSRSVALVNVSLHGAPSDPRSRAVGTALVHVAGIGWLGNLEVIGLLEAALGVSSIGLRNVGLTVDPLTAHVAASVRDGQGAFDLRADATPDCRPILVEQHLPLGRGWISWYAVPRLNVSGTWTAGGMTRTLNGASAYHDHNWGRWHWGDDFGWEWACLLAPQPGPCFVLSRTTDRAHLHCGPPSLTVCMGDLHRTFRGSSVRLDYSGQLEQPLRRLPGALAALHQDRAQPRLPGRLEVRVDDGIDRFRISFQPRAAAQLVAADPIVRGYGFIHELPGEFVCSGRVGATSIDGEGLGVLEHVD